LEKFKAKADCAAKKMEKKKALNQRLAEQTRERTRQLGGVPPENGEELNYVVDSIGALG
jgi:hypothetical protein